MERRQTDRGKKALHGEIVKKKRGFASSLSKKLQSALTKMPKGQHVCPMQGKDASVLTFIKMFFLKE